MKIYVDVNKEEIVRAFNGEQFFGHLDSQDRDAMGDEFTMMEISPEEYDISQHDIPQCMLFSPKKPKSADVRPGWIVYATPGAHSFCEAGHDFTASKVPLTRYDEMISVPFNHGWSVEVKDENLLYFTRNKRGNN